MSNYLQEMFGLTGKVAVVIGGTGELCGAMAEGLAGAGAEVVLVGRNPDKAQARLDKITAAGGKAWFHSTEATSKAEVILSACVVGLMRCKKARISGSVSSPYSTRRRSRR